MWWRMVNKHIIQHFFFFKCTLWIYIVPAHSFETLLICNRKHRAIIINPVEYKGPANRFSSVIFYAVNTNTVVGTLDLEAEGRAV